MSRTLNIIGSIIMLGLMMFFAHNSASEVYSIPYRLDEGYARSDKTQVHQVTNNSFTVKWKGARKTFDISTLVPFKVGDVISFSIRLDGGVGVLEEFHIWESRKKWWIKAIISVLPLILVFVLFFRDYSFNSSCFMFVSRKKDNA